MKVGIATDHGGFGLKEDLVARIRAAGYEVSLAWGNGGKPDREVGELTVEPGPEGGGGRRVGPGRLSGKMQLTMNLLTYKEARTIGAEIFTYHCCQFCGGLVTEQPEHRGLAAVPSQAHSRDGKGEAAGEAPSSLGPRRAVVELHQPALCHLSGL